jgi:hypothetical protein
VASYHLSVHPNVSRGKGQSLVRTAAYNARARLKDERTGMVWDYRHFGGLLFEGIYAAKAPDWARDLGQLVNEIERAEKRSDAQLAMNLDIALPHEQTLEQNRRLIQDFVREQFMRKGYAAHVAIHAPEPDGDRRNVHAHVLVTLRKIGPNGFARTKAEQQERYRNRGAFVDELREKWEQLANRHLARNGIEARIDRRTLAAQGQDRVPQQHRGPAITAMERRGEITHADPQSQHHAQQAEIAAPEPTLPPEPAAPVVEAAAEPPHTPESKDSGEVLTPPPTGGRLYQHDDTAQPAEPSEMHEHPASSFGSGESRTPGRAAAIINGLFREVKTMLRRAAAAPQPRQRRRRGETEGEFRRLARKLVRAVSKVGAAARGRYAVLRDAPPVPATPASTISIPAEFFSADPDWSVFDITNPFYDHGDSFDDGSGFDATSEYLSPGL